MPKQLVFDNFIGGLNLNESTTIKDNELAKAQNCFFDNNERLSSRRGIKNKFNPISDTVTVIATMDSYDGDGTWTAAGDCNTVTTDTTTKRYDAGSVNFDIAVTGTAGTMSNTGITQVDLTSEKDTGYFGCWVYLTVVTDFTSVTLNIGETLTSTDFELAITTQADGSAFQTGWNFLKWEWADMTENGSPDGTIDEIRFTFTFGAGYAGGTDYRLDCIAWYSDTYTNGIHSLYHTKLTDGTKVTMAACGTNVFLLENDTDWVLLADGYTDGERFSFLTYKDVVSFSNGTDNYSYYEQDNESSAGSIVTEDGSSPKAKYIMLVANTAYACGIKDSLTTLKYSTALPANLLNAVWTGSEEIHDDDSREVITGMSKLPSDAIAIYLEKSAYYVDTVPTTTVIRPLDYDGGCVDFRTIQRVGNDTLFLASDAVYSLSQRQSTSGTFGAVTLSENIEPLIRVTKNLTKSNAFRGKHVAPNHYYLNIDTTNNGDPDTCMVYNTKLSAWTEYTNIAAHQMIEFQDSDDNWHIIYANVFSGQVREMETGFDDNGVEIQVKIWTKENDFGDPTLFKEVREMDVSGFLSQTAEIEVIDELDGEDSTTSLIDGNNFDTGTSTVTLGTSPIGLNPLTGETIVGDDIELNLFNIRNNIYNSCFRIQAKLESNVANSMWILSKIQYQIEPLPVDFFPTDNYI